MAATAMTMRKLTAYFAKFMTSLDKFHQVMPLVVMVCGHHVCGRHCHCLWPSWFVAVIVIVCSRHVCGRHCHGLWPSLSWFVAVIVIVCGRHGLWPSLSLFVAVMVCGHIVEPRQNVADNQLMECYARNKRKEDS